MPQFRYSAVGADGAPIKGMAEAVSATGLENELLMNGHSGIKVRERKSLSQIEITKQRVPAQEVMHFSRHMAAFVRTGIPLSEAIRVAREGATNKRFRAILGDIEQDLQAGVPVSQAIARHADVFPPYYVGILRSAELTGQLDIVLDQLSTYIERDLEARSKLKAALTYPAVVFMMSIVTVVIMTVFVLPRFVEFFEELNSELPLSTRLLLDFAAFTSSAPGLALGGAIVLVLLGLGLWGRTPSGRTVRHKVLMRLPLVGTILQYSATERFSRVIAAMMRAGVPLPEAISAAMDSVNNAVFEEALSKARSAMIEGHGIARPLADSGVFPTAALQMVRVGEETGTLDQQIDSAANFYARELEFKLNRLMSMFEPAVILFMGVVVGFVAVALISAMYGVLNGIEDTP